MNTQKLDNKIRKDADKVKKDLNALVEDELTQITRIEDTLNQATGKARENLNAWAEDGIAHFNARFGKFSKKAQNKAASTARTVKQEVGQGLSQYNAKVKEVAGKVPGDFSKKVTSYPWAAVTIGLAVGMLLGLVFKLVSQRSV